MTARLTINATGRVRRIVLTQPPHFRIGQNAPAIKDAATAAADRALMHSQGSRSSRGRSNGSRPATD